MKTSAHVAACCTDSVNSLQLHQVRSSIHVSHRSRPHQSDYMAASSHASWNTHNYSVTTFSSFIAYGGLGHSVLWCTALITIHPLVPRITPLEWTHINRGYTQGTEKENSMTDQIQYYVTDQWTAPPLLQSYTMTPCVTTEPAKDRKAGLGS